MKSILIGSTAFVLIASYPLIDDQFTAWKLSLIENDQQIAEAYDAVSAVEEQTALRKATVAGDEQCSGAGVDVEAEPVVVRDKGTKARAKAISRVSAKPDHFLLVSSIRTSKSGSSDVVYDKLDYTGIEGFEDFESHYVASATYEVYSSDHDVVPVHATAVSVIWALSYPNHCLVYFMNQKLEQAKTIAASAPGT